jgi:tetratricopeptide (TPR) repeat protein
LNTNAPRDLNKGEELELNVIDTPDKYLSCLRSNEATSLGMETTTGRFGLETDKAKHEQSIKKFQEALALDPQNITARQNLISSLNIRQDMGQIKELYRGLFSNLSARYNEIAIDKKLDFSPKEGPKMKDSPDNEYNMYIADKIFDFANILYFDAEDYEGAADAFQAQLDMAGNGLDEADSVAVKAYIAKSNFLGGHYEKFIEQANSILYPNMPNKALSDPSLEKNLDELRGMSIAAKIITGRMAINESNVQEYCDAFKNDPFMGPFISGEQFWNVRYMNAAETLKKWDGFDNMIHLFKEAGTQAVSPRKGVSPP